MNIVTITEVEYLNLLIKHKKNIPIWCGQEVLNCYQNKELCKNTMKLKPLNNLCQKIEKEVR